MEPHTTDTVVPKKENSFLEIVKFAVLAIVIVAPIRMFIAKPFIVSGQSMDPTFASGEYLIVDEISYRFEKPHHGDVIIFKYPLDTSKYFIKRIIGLPGETVQMQNGAVIVYNEQNPKGIHFDESYIKYKTFDNLTIKLKDAEYFVLGDNRAESSDSRYWGVLPQKDIIGRPFIRLLPLNKIDLFPGEYSPDKVVR